MEHLEPVANWEMHDRSDCDCLRYLNLKIIFKF
jgi:hypothetical protein